MGHDGLLFIRARRRNCAAKANDDGIPSRAGEGRLVSHAIVQRTPSPENEPQSECSTCYL
jgi:hypothetical protein